MEEKELLKKRFTELATRSYSGGIYLFTDFLGLSEQAVFEEVRAKLYGIPYTLFGGTEGCERVMISFGSEELCGYEQSFPIDIIKIEGKSPRFAEKLTHRDLLGAILNLGIERAKVGDILLRDGASYGFLSSDISSYIAENLTRVRHTDVKTTIVDSIPAGDLFKVERHTVNVSSVRLDALIAKLFHLSRDGAQALFVKKLVFVSGRECLSTSYKPKENEIISVRGYGRFIYSDISGTSKKGKFNVCLDLYV